MKNIYLLCLLFCCAFATVELSAQTNKEWTMLVYLDGSDLESGSEAGTIDIEEMLDAGATNNVNVVVLTGGANKDGWREIKSYLIEDGEQIPLDFVAVDGAMSNPQNLTDFINWGIDNYPANKYMLNLWNHGMAIRGYGHDENTDSQLKVPQVKNAIANTNFISGGNRFEVLGFDACLMATIEVQATLHNFGHYFVGSEETEPGHGWNYIPVIEAMNNGTATDGAALGRIILDAYKAQSVEQETSNVTLGLIDLSLIPPVLTALEDLFHTIEQGGELKLRSLQQARGKAEEYSKAIQYPEDSEDMVDIGDMMKQLKTVDPSLAGQANAVLNAVNAAVLYGVKDNTRPLATGISMFIPHNKLVEPDEVQRALDEDYNPIEFSPMVKNFVDNVYVPNAHSDVDPPSGGEYDFEGLLRGHGNSSAKQGSGHVSAIRVTHANDLEQVQVILMETDLLGANEYVLLGSTLPDTCFFLEDQSEVFAYYWDEMWLGLNGFPAYISDIHEYRATNTAGDTVNYTRVHIPAILNPDANDDGKDIIISFVYDEDFNVELESIVPDVYGEEVKLTARERINLQPGDRVVLLYEGFNELTDEEFFVIDDDAHFTIENGNEDLVLEHDHLFDGEYAIGYVLTDHSQNDTIIFDSKTFVATTSVIETFADNNIQLYPNPAKDLVLIDNGNFEGKKYQVQVFDLMGHLTYQEVFSAQQANLDISNLPIGYYLVKLVSEHKVYTDKLIIQR